MSDFRDNKFIRVLRVILITLMLTMSLAACGQSMDDTTEGKSACDIQLESKDNCWQSKVFTLIYDAAGDIAITLYEKISEGAFGFIMVMFAFWFSIQALKIFYKSVPMSAGQFWTEILKQLFICVVCGILVSSVDNILWLLNNTIMPLFGAFIDFANEILSASLAGNQNYGSCFSDNNTDASMAGFPEGPKKALECIICKIHGKLVMGRALGFRMMSLDVNISGWLIAILYLFVFLIIDLSFVFYLVDTTIRFGLILAMLPLWIIAFAFKSTKGYTSKAFKYILNCGATLAFVCILMTLIINTIQFFVVNEYPALGPEGCSIVDNNLEAVEGFATFGRPFLSAIFLCFFLLSAISFATKTAGDMVGGGGGDQSQKKIKALAQGVIKLAIGVGGFAFAKSALGKAFEQKKEGLKQSKAGQFLKMFQDSSGKDGDDDDK